MHLMYFCDHLMAAKRLCNVCLHGASMVRARVCPKGTDEPALMSAKVVPVTFLIFITTPPKLLLEAGSIGDDCELQFKIYIVYEKEAS